MNSPLLFAPKPKKIIEKSGSHIISVDHALIIPPQDKDEMFPIAKRARTIIEENCGVRLSIALAGCDYNGKALEFKRNPSLRGDAYILSVEVDKIRIEYGEHAAAFYGVSTLKQMVCQRGAHLPCLKITDDPDFKVRAAMLDISRDKIPKLQTLFDFVDFMADMKLNQLQLYIEGFPFAYPSFPQVWKGETPLTGEDIMELDRYCRDRFIDLVPNQNSFGHMGPWLSRNEFVHLAEETEGKKLWGRYWKAVLNPLDPRSIEFIKKTYEDLLPNFSSDLFNVSCDEVALGKDKTKEMCEKLGVGRVFLDYMMKIYELVNRFGKTMMLWADVVFQYPELFDELPKDIIALDWGYTHDFPYDEHGEILKSRKIPFYVCPGTGSWRSITGRTDNTTQNLVNAAVNGKKHGATGYLITDWGDRGHWQYLPVSYPGFVYGAGLCWAVQENKDLDIAACLDTFVFQDKNNVIGATMLELGRYYHKESNPGIFGPNIFSVLIGLESLDDPKSIEGVKADDLRDVENHILRLTENLDSAMMSCKDAGTVQKELRNAIRMVLHGINLMRLKLSLTEQTTDVPVHPSELLDDISGILNKHIELWLERNSSGGLTRSIHPLNELRRKYAELVD